MGGGWCGGMGGGGWCGKGHSGCHMDSTTSYEQFEQKLSRWKDKLEESAVEMLMELGHVQGEKILHLLTVKSEGSGVENPSGYVRQACKNAKRGLDGTSASAAKRPRM
uniref:Uncharacterized protein n=1 Tax=Noctiluca scintillans TaxID=2966 RepID=A0A7S1F633_NOCSC